MLRRLLTALAVLGVLSGTGCVSVTTPSTSVKVGITDLSIPGGHERDPNAAPYARALRKVSEQQTKVGRQLGEHDWEDLVKRSSEWMDRVRELAGYAGTSSNPALFRSCCQQLQEQVQTLEQAAMMRDMDRSQRAFAACNPPLNTLTQNFPLTRQTAVASPAPQQPAAPAPAPRSTHAIP